MTSVQFLRSQPFGKPLVWANNRQALCDSLSYYKSHQGSLYTSEKTAKGILINKHATVRDMMGPEVIITTLGGGREKEKSSGDMFRAKEGSESLFHACVDAKARIMPIGVILGDKYPLLPIQVDHDYNVLDFFTITDIWSERDTSSPDGIPVWKIRLEKTDRSKPSWWQSKDDVQYTVPVKGFPQGETDCNKCGQSSKQIFSQIWTCLNGECEDSLAVPDHVNIQELSFASHQAAPLAWCVVCHKVSKTVFSCTWACLNKICSAYFDFPTGTDVNNLTYSDEFLHERTAHTLPAQFTVKPQLPNMEMDGLLGTEKEMRTGIVCPQCGCCSRRRLWTCWNYENPACTFVLNAKPLPYPLSVVQAEIDQQRAKPTFDTAKVNENILQASYTGNGYAIEQYLLPDPNQNTKSAIVGSVTIFRSNKAINSESGGPNDMWDDLQRQTATMDFGLQRKPAMHAGLPNETLTRHFLQNWGAPYKFAVAVASKPFTEAPDSIIGALKRLRWAGRISVSKTNNAFQKEMVNVARCASLSEDFVEFNELLSLGYMEDDRINFHDDGENTLGPTVATLSLGSPAQMAFRHKKSYAKNKLVVLKFPLCHGDLVVMHGTRIHRAYEHMVDPKGKRRFALTSRHIDLETLDEQARVDAVQKSILPQISAAWDYPKINSQMAGNKHDSDTTEPINKRRKTKA
ncbi:uncharacterized protein CTRU02_207315 [Colletotrichum truncatum]|uniref:Uncharacterized protein n=1 Tax=Colletotrichum truncatum TaxID=5467 RepID=A0ACC3Z0G4_COLTU|nr:uncharacterized protein CTRU02_01051 [Colletotrichum truncatum]KAF6800646.1 hypothetical protein CTRU02_01051 [Colletotrichum truncatum]